MTNKETLYHAAGLKQQIKTLQEEYDFMEDSIKKAIIELGGDQQKVAIGELGTYSLKGRKTWTYSPQLQAKKIDLKTLEETEQATGKATFIETFSPTFNPKKD